jgi:transcriptional regulator with GAF, ATPase, and Fis domain
MNKKPIPSLLSVKEIFENTSEFTGKDYLKSLVRQLATVLDVYGVWVTEFYEKENQLKALAFWMDGKFVDNYEYNVTGTPCEKVIESNIVCHVPDNVVRLYPDDKDLATFNAVSYLGIALKDADGKVLGNLAMMDQAPMEEIPDVFVVFNLFASKAAAELRRIKYEEHLKENQSKLNRVMNGSMDAILELNENLEIRQANTSAFALFTEEKHQFIGRPIEKYLTHDAFRKLGATTASVNLNQPESKSQWIQGYLQCVNAEGTTIPADATLSCYSFKNEKFYALYLRDVQDRISSEQEIKKLTIETTLLREKIGKEESNLIGESDAIQRTLTQIAQVAPTNSTVLLLGETGTGKELIARAIHQQSRRKDKPYIILNCAAIPSELMESELFGHTKGAFTGATDNRDGRFKLADKGTIFLDEIGELPLSLQPKLLRVIQEGEFQPVGSATTHKVDVRIIAATHRNLKKEVDTKKFRADLYYRLNVFPIQVPPLRDRGNDILLMAGTFLKKYADRHGQKVNSLSESDKQKLLMYSWPGNIRELQNIIERAVITNKNGELQLAIQNSNELVPQSKNVSIPRLMTQDELQKLEIQNIQLALQKANGKVFGENGAAQLLDIPPTTLSSKLKKFGLNTRLVSQIGSTRSIKD